MKKIFNGLILILFAALVSCADEFKVGDAFLEKAPSVDVDKDVVFNDANYARAFLWNAYTSLYYGRPLNWSAKGNSCLLYTSKLTTGLSFRNSS